MQHDCTHCHEPVLDDERYETVTHICANPEHAGPRRIHVECVMRSVVGSAQHLMRKDAHGRCDLTCTDPPGMTKREAARAAVDIFRAEHGQPPLDWSKRDPWSR